MIIKSMSRSSQSFGQLYDYLTRDADAELGAYNLYASAYEKEELVKEFMRNAAELKRSRGKNYLYHEIIALEHSSLSLDKQREILKELTKQYLSQRAADHLAFTALHKDKDHLHVHLMISSNTLMGQRRVRLSKKDFALIQKNAELYLKQRHPELNSSEHYQDASKKAGKSRSEQELESRSKKPSKKEELRQTLQELFEKSSSEASFNKALEKQGITFYSRGKTQGVVCEGKKYRLKTLNLQVEYNKLLNKLEATKAREERRAKQKASKTASRTIDRSKPSDELEKDRF